MGKQKVKTEYFRENITLLSYLSCTLRCLDHRPCGWWRHMGRLSPSRVAPADRRTRGSTGSRFWGSWRRRRRRRRRQWRWVAADRRGRIRRTRRPALAPQTRQRPPGRPARPAARPFCQALATWCIVLTHHHCSTISLLLRTILRTLTGLCQNYTIYIYWLVFCTPHQWFVHKVVLYVIIKLLLSKKRTCKRAWNKNYKKMRRILRFMLKLLNQSDVWPYKISRFKEGKKALRNMSSKSARTVRTSRF